MARLADERDGVLALLATAGTVGSWVWLPATNTWTCSPPMCRLYGLAPGFRPHTFEAYRARLHPDDRFAVTAALAAAVRDGGAFGYEERVLQPDGSLRLLRTDGVVLRGGGLEPLRVVALCVDRTEQAAIEQALAARNAALALENHDLRAQNEALARRLEALAREAAARTPAATAPLAVEQQKDALLGVLSHELRTPLNAIVGFAEILGDELQGPLNEAQHASVDQVMGGATRMTRLVDELMDAARIRAGEPLVVLREVDYGAVATDVIAGFQARAAAAGIALLAEVGLVTACALDAGRVAQVLGHLLDNALKFTPAGGRVLVRIFELGGCLVTEVADTGPGVPAGFAERAFRAFEQLDMGRTRRAGGTGLGLALARALVEAHGGAIGVAPSADGGASFWFTLPVRA